MSGEMLRSVSGVQIEPHADDSPIPVTPAESASRNGSKTPFWSLLLSKPVSDWAVTLTFTVPAMSARLAMAFHAVKS